MEWLCALAVGLIAFAAIGHFLWWVAATTLRGLLGAEPGDERAAAARPFTRCPACRAAVEQRDVECRLCGLPLDTHTARQLARVRAAEAEVRELADMGDLDADTAKTVAARLERRARLLQGLPADAPPPAPVPAPPRSVPKREATAAAPAPEPPVLVPSVAPPAAVPPAPPADTAPPAPPPRRGSVLAAFMEERNILWGEVVGGLLIVGCSIALVVTLWNRIETIPYFPFLLSALVTGALYGAGHYTLHHWKLESTSRGLLIIALLLAPLNLLLLSDPISRADVPVPFDVGFKLGAVALLAWVVRGGGRDVLIARPSWRWLVALAVVGAPAAQLLPAAWFAGPFVNLPAWLALGCFAGAVVIALRAPTRGEPVSLDRDAGVALLQFVGLAAFGLAAAWGMHIARSPDVADRVRGLALPLALAAVPVVEAGLLVQRRILGGGLRAAGTGVALAGIVVMTAALAAAWVDPLSVLLVSVAVGLFLTRIAFRESLPWVHAGAIPALALAAAVGYHGLAGRWAEPLANLLRSADTGVVLVGFALVLAAVAELLARRGLRTHAVSYARGGVAVGLAGLFLVTVNGPEYPARAAAAHAACAGGLLAANYRWRLRAAANVGLWLVLIASLWTLHAAHPGDYALWGFVVSLEALAFAGLPLVLKGYRGGATALLRRAGRDVSLAAAALAVLAPMSAVSAGTAPDSPWHTGTLFALALTGLALARLTGFPVATYLGSTAAFLGFLHLTLLTWNWKPETLAGLGAVLTHATLATLTALGLRRLERVFAYPLRKTALVATGIAAALLLLPGADLALAWAGCAVWLALVWLTFALVWRERGAFPAFQVALTLAAVLTGVAWVNAQEWRPATSLGFIEPAALHAYAVAVGLLGLAWVLARRGLRHNTTARELWITQTWSAERVVLATVVVAQLLLVALAVLPEVKAELRPSEFKPFRAEPIELAQAFGAGAWTLLGVLAAVVIASWRLTGGERDTDPHLAGLVLLFLTVPVVWAGSHAADTASATALRWGLGLAFVAGTAAVAARRPLRVGLERAGFPVHPSPLSRPSLLALLAVAAGVVVVISAQVAELGLSGRKPSGPVADSAFAAAGPIVSNLVPLALVVLGLAGTAARERSSGYAFAGGLVFTATLAAGYALGVITAGGVLDSGEQVRVWLLVAGAPAAWALVWLAAERRVPGGPLLATQTRLGLFVLACIATGPVMFLLVRPGTPLNPSALVLGQLGWIALALAAAAAVWQSLRTEPGLKLHALALTATIVGVLVACAAQPWDGEGRWLSFHTLAAVWTAVGVGLIAAARKRGEASVWLDGVAAALAVMAVRGGWADPWRPWLPAGLAVAAATLVGTSAVFNRSSARVILSVLLIDLAAVLLWLPAESRTTSGFLLANAAGLAVAAAVWTLVAPRLFADRWHDLPDLTRGIALVLLAFGLAPTLAGERVDSHWLTWGATLAVVATMTVALWDRNALAARGGLFAAGVATVLLGVSATTTLAVWDVWQTPIALAGYVFLTSGLAVRVGRATKPVLGIPERGDPWGWLLVAQGVVAAAVIGLGLRIELTAPEWAERLAAPGAVFLLFATVLVLRDALPTWKATLEVALTALLVSLFVTGAWSMPDLAEPHIWLHRTARLFVFLSLGLLTMMTHPRLLKWVNSLRGVTSEGGRFLNRDVGVFAALAFVVLCVNLLQQVPVYDRETRHTPLEGFDVTGMLLGILVLIVLAVRFALRQDLDPLHMRDSRRTAYVYLAEVLLVLFFTHIRFNVPELFLGAAVRYWTFVVMGLAFVGIGLAEFFERRRVNVLAIPLRRTGVLLPLIPLLAFWAKPPAFLSEFAAGQAPGLSPFLAYLEKLPQHFDTYAWLWFLAGGLYGLVALSRQSFGWALLAALATNAALWSLLTHHEVPFVVHPQAWVIPLALIVLVSEHVNRHRLRADVSNGLRYLGVGMIYVASAADMFIAGVGQSVWLPVILAVFCVAGVLAGIMMRVRAFVFLGVGFLLLDIFAMIWHAAVNLEQTWVWYASGIVLGVAILALFAVFEKRKKARAEG